MLIVTMTVALTGCVRSESKMYSEAVERAKRKLAQEDAISHYVDLEGCLLREDDRLNFNGHGCREAADRIFRCLKDLDLLPLSSEAR